jgi:hypothetical protein
MIAHVGALPLEELVLASLGGAGALVALARAKIGR